MEEQQETEEHNKQEQEEQQILIEQDQHSHQLETTEITFVQLAWKVEEDGAQQDHIDQLETHTVHIDHITEHVLTIAHTDMRIEHTIDTSTLQFIEAMYTQEDTDNQEVSSVISEITTEDISTLTGFYLHQQELTDTIE